MNNVNLIQTALHNDDELVLIQELKSINGKDNKKAQLLAFSNSLLLSNSNISKDELYSYFIKSYLINKNDNNKIDDVDFLINSIKSFITGKNKVSEEASEIYLRSITHGLLEFVSVDDNIRYELALNYVRNLDKINLDENINKEDKDTYLSIISELNRINNENKKAKKINKIHSRIYYSNR